MAAHERHLAGRCCSPRVLGRGDAICLPWLALPYLVLAIAVESIAGIYQSSRSHELGLGTRCAPACSTPLPRSIEQVETVIGKVDYEEDNAGGKDDDGGCKIGVVVALSGRAR